MHRISSTYHIASLKGERYRDDIKLIDESYEWTAQGRTES